MNRLYRVTTTGGILFYVVSTSEAGASAKVFEYITKRAVGAGTVKASRAIAMEPSEGVFETL